MNTAHGIQTLLSVNTNNRNLIEEIMHNNGEVHSHKVSRVPKNTTGKHTLPGFHPEFEIFNLGWKWVRHLHHTQVVHALIYMTVLQRT